MLQHRCNPNHPPVSAIRRGFFISTPSPNQIDTENGQIPPSFPTATVLLCCQIAIIDSLHAENVSSEPTTDLMSNHQKTVIHGYNLRNQRQAFGAFAMPCIAFGESILIIKVSISEKRFVYLHCDMAANTPQNH